MGMSRALLAIPTPADQEPALGGAAAERRLIDHARSDPDAYAVLYRHHFAAIAGYLYRRLGDQHLAEDLAAETFIAAWRALGRYRHTGVPFRSWLLRIATNQANAWARARKRESQPPVPERSTNPDTPSEHAEELRLLHRALRRLSPQHQSVIALVYLESMSLSHAAEVLGVAEGTVKSRLARARTDLRTHIERLGGEP